MIADERSAKRPKTSVRQSVQTVPSSITILSKTALPGTWKTISRQLLRRSRQASGLVHAPHHSRWLHLGTTRVMSFGRLPLNPLPIRWLVGMASHLSSSKSAQRLLRLRARELHIYLLMALRRPRLAPTMLGMEPPGKQRRFRGSDRSVPNESVPIPRRWTHTDDLLIFNNSSVNRTHVARHPQRTLAHQSRVSMALDRPACLRKRLMGQASQKLIWYDCLQGKGRGPQREVKTV